jgi:hypothetical protein
VALLFPAQKLSISDEGMSTEMDFRSVQPLGGVWRGIRTVFIVTTLGEAQKRSDALIAQAIT